LAYGKAIGAVDLNDFVKKAADGDYIPFTFSWWEGIKKYVSG